MELEFEEVVQAYFDCRRHKRRTIHALDFEFNLERNLIMLYEDLVTERYEIGKSVVFIVEQPKIREIWSSTFRDRVVHHIIYNRLNFRFLPTFIRNSFACIPERGTLDGSNRLQSGMRKVTKNWSKKAYFLSVDVRNFFVSIHKPTLFTILARHIVEPWLMRLTQQVLFHDPRQHCLMKSTQRAFDLVPNNRSLWKSPPERGLPIGNLTSQFFANVYLNELDQFAKHKLKVRWYYRYVDDCVMLSESLVELNKFWHQSSEYVSKVLHLEFHPFKKRIDSVDRGIDFVGFIHFPYRRYLRRRTTNKMRSFHEQWQKNAKGLSEESLFKYRASMNSYWGLARYAKTYTLRKKIGTEAASLFIRPDKDYLKLVLAK